MFSPLNLLKTAACIFIALSIRPVGKLELLELLELKELRLIKGVEFNYIFDISRYLRCESGRSNCKDLKNSKNSKNSNPYTFI